MSITHAGDYYPRLTDHDHTKFLPTHTIPWGNDPYVSDNWGSWSGTTFQYIDLNTFHYQELVDGDNLTLVVDMPGVDPETIEVKIETGSVRVDATGQLKFLTYYSNDWLFEPEAEYRFGQLFIKARKPTHKITVVSR